MSTRAASSPPPGILARSSIGSQQARQEPQALQRVTASATSADQRLRQERDELAQRVRNLTDDNRRLKEKLLAAEMFSLSVMMNHIC